MLMVDIDYDNNIVNYNEAISMLFKYAKKFNKTFIIRETDRGLHAFLVSEVLDPKTNLDAEKLMYNLNCDINYIAYSKIRWYHTRIGIKPYKKLKGEIGAGDVLLNQDEVKKEFISRKPKKYIIGNPSNILPELQQLINLNDELVEYTRKQYQENYSIMTTGIYYGKKGMIPKKYLKNKIIPDYEKILFKYFNNIETFGNFPYESGPKIV